MQTEQFIQRLENLEAIIRKAESGFQEQSEMDRKDIRLKTAAVFRQETQQVIDKNKLLAIGIIGRVKAGKSSLLNALLFDGKDVLPKAATPMTAALTIMEYSEEIKAVAEFYSQEDLAAIRQAAANILPIKERRVAEKIAELKAKGRVAPNEIAARAEKAVIRELADHPDYALYEQNEQIGNRTLPSSSEAEIKADSVEALMGKLSDYVGANGKYMPFTKAVRLYLPYENLKGLQIIDTPGVNDPVASRSARTEQELSRCDVVLVVSPAGQFMSAEDMGLISKVTQGEGIGETYLVASQADNQLIGLAQEHKTVSNAYQALASDLTVHAHSVLNQDASKFSKVLARFEKHKVICSSSVAYVLNKYLQQRNEWDENAQHVWNNLSQFYPADFASTAASATLQQLSNIDKVQQVIDEVKPRREAIFQAKLDDAIKGQERCFADFVKKSTAYLDEKIKALNEIDDTEAKRRIHELQQSKAKGENTLNQEFSNMVADLAGQVGIPLRRALKYAVRSIDPNSKQGTETEIKTESYEVKVGERSTSSWWNPFSWGDTESIYETRYRDYTVSHDVVYATQIKNEIYSNLRNISRQLDKAADEVLKSWKKNTKRTLISLVRHAVGDENIEIAQIERVVTNVFSNLPIADFVLNTDLPSSLEKSGTIRMNSGGREFLAAAIEFVKNFEQRAESEINAYLSGFDALKQTNIATDLFQKLEQEAAKLQKDIQDKENRIREWTDLKKALVNV